MRVWRAAISLIGGKGYKSSCSTCFKSYNLKQIGEVMNKIRQAEVLAGLPKRKVSPITTYLLEEQIRIYFEDYAPEGGTLETIKIREENEI